MHQDLCVAGVSQFTCDPLDGVHSSDCVFPDTENYHRSQHLVVGPQFAPRIVRVLQMSNLSRHLVKIKSIIMFVSRARYDFVCILSFELCVGHYQIALSALPIDHCSWNCMSNPILTQG